MAFSIFAMPSSSLVLLLSVAFGVGNALPWSGPQPTEVYQPDNWTPKPTGVPVNPRELFKRKSVSINVCGWIAGISSEPAVCSTGSSCIHDTVHGYVGCCTTSGPCTEGVYTTCVDLNNADWKASPGIVNNGIYTCSSSSVCYRNTYPGPYYQWGCGSSDWAGQVATTYSGQSTDMLLQQVFTGVTFSPMSAKSSTTSTSSSSSSSSTSSTESKTTGGTDSGSGANVSKVASSAAAATSTGSSSSDSGSKTNVGAIAGGIGGGIAGLALISALIFFLCCRGRRNNGRPVVYNRETKGNGPFQAVNTYAPEDYPSQDPNVPRSHVAGVNFPQTYEYAGAAQPNHPYADHPANSTIPPFQPLGLGSENHPLVSTEIDDFSRGYHNALNANLDQDRDTHIHNGTLPGPGETGIIPIGAPLRGLSLAGNSRTQDRELTSEPFRQPGTISNQVSAQTLNTTNSDAQDHQFNRIDSYRDDGSHPHGRESPEGYFDEDEERGISHEPSSPLRENIRANLAAAAAGVMGRKERERDDRPRYQLVDEVVGDDVPILHSPGQLRGARAKKSQ